jgi:hypothetical protein
MIVFDLSEYQIFIDAHVRNEGTWMKLNLHIFY